MRVELMINMKDDRLLYEDMVKIDLFLSKLNIDDVIDIHNHAAGEINHRHGMELK